MMNVHPTTTCQGAEDVMSAATQHRTHHSNGEAEAISHVVRRLRQQFPELTDAAIEQAVYGHYEQFDGRPIRDFVPILVERAAADQLAHGNESAAL
jgi:hypothetical protein